MLIHIQQLSLLAFFQLAWPTGMQQGLLSSRVSNQLKAILLTLQRPCTFECSSLNWTPEPLTLPNRKTKSYFFLLKCCLLMPRWCPTLWIHSHPRPGAQRLVKMLENVKWCSQLQCTVSCSYVKACYPVLKQMSNIPRLSGLKDSRGLERPPEGPDHCLPTCSSSAFTLNSDSCSFPLICPHHGLLSSLIKPGVHTVAEYKNTVNDSPTLSQRSHAGSTPDHSFWALRNVTFWTLPGCPQENLSLWGWEPTVGSPASFHRWVVYSNHRHTVKIYNAHSHLFFTVDFARLDSLW